MVTQNILTLKTIKPESLSVTLLINFHQSQMKHKVQQLDAYCSGSEPHMCVCVFMYLCV